MSRRHRIRRRSPIAKWAGRVLGLAGTAVVLAVGVVAATMILPGDDEHGVAPAPAATPAREPAGKQSAKKKPRVSAQQREERRRAVDQVRRDGYTPVSLADYRPDHILRVLIGEPVGTTPPGLRAFFFVDDEYIGQDAAAPSGKLRPGRQLEREITLVYTLYKPGDRACCPKGKEARVHFRWSGEALEPREAIPPDAERLAPS